MCLPCALNGVQTGGFRVAQWTEDSNSDSFAFHLRKVFTVMGFKRVGIGAGVLASAAALAFAGTASAAPAVEAVPTADYQLCGNVYSGAGLEYNAAPPAAAQGVSGVVISGVISTAPSTTYTATTDSAGRYCIQAPNTMKADVLGGATVKLTAGTPPSPFTTITNNPWKSAAVFGTTNIGTIIFAAHQYGSLSSNSAYHFNFVAS